MADQKLTDKIILNTLNDNDIVHVVDVSNTSSSPEGTSSRVLLSVLKAFIGGASFEGYTESGTRAGGDLVVIIGDYDDSGNGIKIKIDDSNESIDLDGEVFALRQFTMKPNVPLFFTNPAGTFVVSINADNIDTTEKTLQLPNASGTLALTSEYIVNIEDFGAIADNGTTDCTQAYLDAIDVLIALNGGTLIIPNRGNDRFHITINETTHFKNYSNITIEGGGKIFIDFENIPQAVTQGRGALIVLDDGTDNFTIRDLDILVDAAVLNNNFIYGVICSKPLAGFSNITIDNLKIYSEVRPDTQIGNHGITFDRDVLNVLDINEATNVKITNCDIKLYGQSVYGIHTLRTINTFTIENNTIELTAWDDNANDAFNAIAVYGNSNKFNVIGNTINSSGHSAIAASMSQIGNITNNFVKNVSITAEAGIEIEYKLGHGDITFQPHSINVHNNYVDSCYYGIFVTERSSTATTLAPYNVKITNNTIINSELIDIIVASNVAGTPNYITRIKDVIVDGNYCESSASIANIYFYDSDGGTITNNTAKGGAINLQIGRSTTIFPIGFFDISNNKFSENTTEVAFKIESTGVDTFFNIDGNEIKPVAGTRGIQALSLLITGTVFNITNNRIVGGSDGFRFSNEAADIANSKFSGNYAINCTVRGFHLDVTNGSFINNYAINCVVANTFAGVGSVNTNNQEN